MLNQAASALDVGGKIFLGRKFSGAGGEMNYAIGAGERRGIGSGVREAAAEPFDMGRSGGWRCGTAETGDFLEFGGFKTREQATAEKSARTGEEETSCAKVMDFGGHGVTALYIGGMQPPMNADENSSRAKIEKRKAKN